MDSDPDTSDSERKAWRAYIVECCREQYWLAYHAVRSARTWLTPVESALCEICHETILPETDPRVLESDSGFLCGDCYWRDIEPDRREILRRSRKALEARDFKAFLRALARVGWFYDRTPSYLFEAADASILETLLHISYNDDQVKWLDEETRAEIRAKAEGLLRTVIATY